MEFKVRGGVYPTMITPYKNGGIDYDAVEKLVEWYWNEGCDGIFAACQSSEIMFLSLEERVKLTRTVIAKAKALAEADKSREPMMRTSGSRILQSSSLSFLRICLLVHMSAPSPTRDFFPRR